MLEMDNGVEMNISKCTFASNRYSFQYSDIHKKNCDLLIFLALDCYIFFFIQVEIRLLVGGKKQGDRLSGVIQSNQTLNKLNPSLDLLKKTRT
jgi:hypothetical protein